MRTPFNKEAAEGTGAKVAGRPRKSMLRRSSMRRSEILTAYTFLLPWIIGFCVFTFGPLVASLYLSFTEYNVLQPPSWVGFQNYKTIFTQDNLFRQSLFNSIYYTVLYIPIHIIIALLVAVLLNTKVRGIPIWRTLFYLPVVTPVIASAVLWRFILNPQVGIVNQGLRTLGLPAPGWTTDPSWLVPSLVIMVTWGAVGSTMVLYLAGLQGIPTELYEAANIDGAGWWSKMLNVTLPMLSPVIFFTLVVGIIGSIQIFAQARVLFNVNDQNTGGPGNAGLMYMMYLFDNAFSYFKMGYASALAWILFIVILIITVIQFWGSRHWVYYEGESR